MGSHAGKKMASRHQRPLSQLGEPGPIAVPRYAAIANIGPGSAWAAP